MSRSETDQGLEIDTDPSQRIHPSTKNGVLPRREGWNRVMRRGGIVGSCWIIHRHSIHLSILLFIVLT